MADIQMTGHIVGVRYTPTAVIVTASERKQGFKKNDGTIVPDDVLTFRFIFKPYFKKYISTHFSENMLVKMKGVLLPYAKDHEGNTIDGFSIIGQTIDREAYPSNNLRIEKKMIKESQMNTTETPDLERFEEPDF